MDKVTTLNAEEATPYVGEALRQLRAEVRTCNAAGTWRRPALPLGACSSKCGGLAHCEDSSPGPAVLQQALCGACSNPLAHCGDEPKVAGACMRGGKSAVACGVQVGNKSTVLGFVGAPFTLASYIVEGGSSKSYTHIKRLAFGQPAVLHALLTKLADNVADYVRYQARSLNVLVPLVWLRLFRVIGFGVERYRVSIHSPGAGLGLLSPSMATS